MYILLQPILCLQSDVDVLQEAAVLGVLTDLGKEQGSTASSQSGQDGAMEGG